MSMMMGPIVVVLWLVLVRFILPQSQTRRDCTGDRRLAGPPFVDKVARTCSHVFIPLFQSKQTYIPYGSHSLLSACVYTLHMGCYYSSFPIDECCFSDRLILHACSVGSSAVGLFFV